jgi:hypothetical protein
MQGKSRGMENKGGIDRPQFEQLSLSSQLSLIQEQLEKYNVDALTWFCENYLADKKVC